MRGQTNIAVGKTGNRIQASPTLLDSLQKKKRSPERRVLVWQQAAYGVSLCCRCLGDELKALFTSTARILKPHLFANLVTFKKASIMPIILFNNFHRVLSIEFSSYVQAPL